MCANVEVRKVHSFRNCSVLPALCCKRCRYILRCLTDGVPMLAN